MCRCLLLFSLFCLLSFPALSQTFLQGTEDVPLMADFEISKDETFWLESQDGNGRLFFSKAFTQIEPERVLAFYHQTLPELGWHKLEDGSFEREGDILKIAVESGAFESRALTSVIFELITK